MIKHLVAKFQSHNNKFVTCYPIVNKSVITFDQMNNLQVSFRGHECDNRLGLYLSNHAIYGRFMITIDLTFEVQNPQRPLTVVDLRGNFKVMKMKMSRCILMVAPGLRVHIDKKVHHFTVNNKKPSCCWDGRLMAPKQFSHS